MTTDRVGGLRKPPWGMSQAEPIGSPKESANRTTFTDMPLKGTFLLVLCYWLTCKRVYKLFYTHLIFFIILLQLIPYVLLYCLFISSYCVYIISPAPNMPVPIFVLQICIFLKYHQTALPFEISHYLWDAILRRDWYKHMYMIFTCLCFYYFYTFVLTEFS